MGGGGGGHSCDTFFFKFGPVVQKETFFFKEKADGRTGDGRRTKTDHNNSYPLDIFALVS